MIALAPGPRDMGRLDRGRAFHLPTASPARVTSLQTVREERTNVLNDVVRGEKLEAELNAMIEKRALKASGEQQFIEDAWAESARVHQRRTRERNRWEWIRFFERMAENHARMSEDYGRRASALLGEGRA